MKTVYVPMSADLLHPGHINIIRVARELGEVTVGLATDELIERHKRHSTMRYEHRKVVIENIRGVSQVIPQPTLDLVPNLRRLKPDYLVHGDDWRAGSLREVRHRAIGALKEWGGELVEPPYTQGISSTLLNAAQREPNHGAGRRRRGFRQLLADKPFVRALGAYSGLSAMIVEHSRVSVDGTVREFEAMWLNQLTDSSPRGRSGTESTGLGARISLIREVLERTTKPLMLDIDSGVGTEDFVSTISFVEQLGASAAIIQAKTGPRRASGPRCEAAETASDANEFARRISEGKKATATEDFWIVSRIEPPASDRDLKDGITWAQASAEAGADAILILTPKTDSATFLDFCTRIAKLEKRLPLLVLHTANGPFSESQLMAAGVQFVIYGDHLLRSAYSNMIKTAKTILRQSGTLEAEAYCAAEQDLLTFVRGDKLGNSAIEPS